jgi:hypothetical protein
VGIGVGSGTDGAGLDGLGEAETADVSDADAVAAGVAVVAPGVAVAGRGEGVARDGTAVGGSEMATGGAERAGVVSVGVRTAGLLGTPVAAVVVNAGTVGSGLADGDTGPVAVENDATVGSGVAVSFATCGSAATWRAHEHNARINPIA